MQLYEFMNMYGEGFDIGDDVWDWGTYFPYVDESDKDLDPYDKLMILFAKNIELIKFKKDWYSICKVDKYIRDNLKIFEAFLNEVYVEGYRPMDLDIDLESEDFYDLYIDMFNGLIIGNFSNEEYNILLSLFEKENILWKEEE